MQFDREPEMFGFGRKQEQQQDPVVAAAANLAASLKQQKEQFVSDLTGGPIDEIYYITTVSLTAYFTYSSMYKYYRQSTAIPIDFSLQVVGLLLSISLYAENVTSLHFLVGIPGIIIYLLARLLNQHKSSKKKNANVDLLPKKSFITAYRSHMIIITNIAILAVDYKIFPRRFAKVETWGTSLMDMGVGSFVFSMGLANSRSVIKQRFKSSDKSSYKFKVSQHLKLIYHNTVKALPVLGLGLIRLVSVKTLEYQEHATEYGIHWNFFITLGLLPIFLGILDPLLNLLPRFLIAAIIGVAYEALLNYGGLVQYILKSNNRFDNIISMNKEGICSFAGYLSIFIFGQSFGSFVLTGYKTPFNLIKMTLVKQTNQYKANKKRTTLEKWFSVSTTQGLAIMTCSSHLIFWFILQNSSVSRRLANLPYIFWVISYNSTLLLGYNLIEKYIGESESRVLNAINNNGLAIFLLGNLGTGLINLTTNTLEANEITAFLVLLIYAATFTTIALVLDHYKIYIKL